MRQQLNFHLLFSGPWQLSQPPSGAAPFFQNHFRKSHLKLSLNYEFFHKFFLHGELQTDHFLLLTELIKFKSLMLRRLTGGEGFASFFSQHFLCSFGNCCKIPG